jgi:hypothetical protein
MTGNANVSMSVRAGDREIEKAEEVTENKYISKT